MELKIGNLIAKLPIIQGGMGVGVSLSSLAGNVAKHGAIGVISAAHPGYLEEDFEKNTLQANIRALKKHVIKAKEISPVSIRIINKIIILCENGVLLKFVFQRRILVLILFAIEFSFICFIFTDDSFLFKSISLICFLGQY